MKRIMLSIDLEDNQVLSDSIKKAMEDYAKQIARDQFNKILQDEIERLIKHYTKQYLYDPDSWTRRELCKKIQDATNNIMKEEGMLRSELHGLLEQKIGYVEVASREYLSKVEQRDNKRLETLDARINEQVRQSVDRAVKGFLANEFLNKVFAKEDRSEVSA